MPELVQSNRYWYTFKKSQIWGGENLPRPLIIFMSENTKEIKKIFRQYKIKRALRNAKRIAISILVFPAVLWLHVVDWMFTGNFRRRLIK